MTVTLTGGCEDTHYGVLTDSSPFLVFFTNKNAVKRNFAIISHRLCTLYYYSFQLINYVYRVLNFKSSLLLYLAVKKKRNSFFNLNNNTLMKAYSLFNFILKIIGALALWKAIQYFALLVASFGILFRDGNAYTAGMLIMTVLPFLFSLCIGLYLILRTKRVLSYFQFNEEDEVRMNLESPAFYRVIILIAGFVLIIHGAGNAFSVSYSWNTNYKNGIQQVGQNQMGNNSNTRMVTTTTNNKMDVNYFSMIEIVLGILFLVQWRSIGEKLYRRAI